MGSFICEFKVSISSTYDGAFDAEITVEIEKWNTILSYWANNCTSYEPKYGIGIPMDRDCGEEWANNALIGFYDENDLKAFPIKGKTVSARSLGSRKKNLSHTHILELNEDEVVAMTEDCLRELLDLPKDCLFESTLLTGHYMGVDVTFNLSEVSHETLCRVLGLLQKANQCEAEEFDAVDTPA